MNHRQKKEIAWCTYARPFLRHKPRRIRIGKPEQFTPLGYAVLVRLRDDGQL
jgi:hypothetical protein